MAATSIPIMAIVVIGSQPFPPQYNRTKSLTTIVSFRNGRKYMIALDASLPHGPFQGKSKWEKAASET